MSGWMHNATARHEHAAKRNANGHRLDKQEFVGEINGDACEENKRLPLALFNNAENRVVHLWRWIRYDSSV